MVCEPGDLVIANRQTLHGSFANTSQDRRVSLYFGFNPRSSVLGVRNKNYDPVVVYDEACIHERSRLIALAIDARQQRFPDEPRYVYQPLAGQEDANRWNETTRESILKDYTVRDLNI
jgi:ectoine hydroxylase-related dioxygenase (phytanoyl-CoA dioxygenase family)